MPWLSVNHTRLSRLTAVPIPLFALDVHRGAMPGQPAAIKSICDMSSYPARSMAVIWKS
jgi:hypothetical protein